MLEPRRLPGVGSRQWARIVDATARWWLAELWLELGEQERAAVYLRSFRREGPGLARTGP